MSGVSEAERGLGDLPPVERSPHMLRPPEYLETAKPILFLAGPVSGAPHWHGEAEAYLQKLAPEFVIANPNTDGLPDKVPHQARTEWEEHHLVMAGERGFIIFWLPSPVTERAVEGYAKTTMFELGEWKQRHVEYGAHLVLGIEPGAPNESYLRQRFERECPEITIHSTLVEACVEATQVLKTICH